MAVSVQRRRRVLLAVVAALIAAGVFVLVLSQYGKAPSGNTQGAVTPPSVPSRSVVEAREAISQGAQLTAANLTTASVPVSELPTSSQSGVTPWYGSTAPLTATKMFATTPILAGEIINSTMVTDSTAAAVGGVPGTSFNIPSGYVAVALPFDPSGTTHKPAGGGTGGYVEAGDRIDILAEIDPAPNPQDLLGNEYFAYQDVLVIAVGESSGAAPSSAAGSTASPSAAAATSANLIMVEVPQQDAAVLTYLEDASNVTLQYLVVSAGDYPPRGTPGPSPVGNPQTITPGGVTQFFGG